MSIPDGHNTPAICYTKRMHEIDETDFPPIPPPPPMTAEQREMAEAAIRAAIAREAERHAQIMDAEICCAEEPELSYDEAMLEDSCAGEICRSMAAMPCECAGGVPRTKHGRRLSTLFSRRKKAALPAIDLPENKPRKPNLQAANLSFAARVITPSNSWTGSQTAAPGSCITVSAHGSRGPATRSCCPRSRTAKPPASSSG